MIFGNRIFRVSILMLACIAFLGCATAKKLAPWGKRSSDSSEPSPSESTRRVDLSVPGIDRDQRAIVDPIGPVSSSVAGLGADAIATSEPPADVAAGRSSAGDDDWGRVVQQAIHSRWVQPRGPNIPTDFSCDVMVKLTPFGGVDDVKIVRSCGDVALDASIETAVRESSPLPTPKNLADFSDTLMLTFTPR